MKQRLALFGGSFDPIHIGHTIVAEYAMHSLAAEKVVFIPAKRSPHKHVFPVASDRHRMAMIQLAIRGKEQFEMSDCELKRGDPSYTLDTINEFNRAYGSKAELFWLVGADVIRDLDRWYHVEELMDRCTICVMVRAGYPRPDFSILLGSLKQERVKQLDNSVIETPMIDISSSEIRTRLAGGKEVNGLVCPSVLAYIRENSLYSVENNPIKGGF
ncbi:MAG: nicotinate (nicotinamide) nucleotide adenylyltransferase [Sedimentisphaerales bacterium]|nr:nicotinate (nicotinamide) nucleotide adenylyltransferase [Sedimentisphaerales bacterium]